MMVYLVCQFIDEVKILYFAFVVIQEPIFLTLYKGSEFDDYFATVFRIG